MSKPLRIAMFVGSFPAVSETFIIRQITGLLDLGHEVDIFSELRGETDSVIHGEIEKYGLLKRTTFMDMPPEIFPGELSIWPLTGRTWPPGEEKPIENRKRLARALPKILRCGATNPRVTLQTLRRDEFGFQAESLSALYRLEKVLSHGKNYDVAHAHFGPVGNSFRFVKKLWKVPLLVTFHGYDFSSAPRESGANMYEKLFATVDAITVNSRYAGDVLEKLGCPAAKISQLNVGLNVAEFPFRERMIEPGGQIRICSVGRLVEKKGYEFSLRAVAKLRARQKKVRYEIIGDGPLKEQLQTLVRGLGIGGSVIFHGAQTSDFVRRTLTESHIFMLPSVTAADGDTEGTPVSLMEAQALGMPVLSTRHAGIPEIVADGRAGFLVEEKDAEALAERLIFLAEHPENWPTLGWAGHWAMEQKHSLAQLNRDLAGLYEKMRTENIGR